MSLGRFGGVRDLHQMELLEQYEHLTPTEHEDLVIVIRSSTLHPVEDTVESGHVEAATLVTMFFADELRRDLTVACALLALRICD